MSGQIDAKANQSAYVGMTTDAFDFWGAPVLTATDRNAAMFGVQAGDLICPGFTGPTYASNPWDYVAFVCSSLSVSNPLLAPSLLGGAIRTPGISTVTTYKQLEHDIKKASGGQGARITIHGLRPGQIDISTLIWTPQQLKQLKELLNLLFIGKQIAVRAYHPALEIEKINALLITEAVVEEGGSVPRSKTFRLRATEYFPPSPPSKNYTKSPKAPKPTPFNPGCTEPRPLPGTDSGNTGP